MAATASFASAPRTEFAQLSVANTNRDGTGAIVNVITGAATGTRVDAVEICAAVATTAGVVRLYLHDGTNTRLLREIMVPAITPSTSVPVFNERITDLALILGSAAWSLRASTHNAEVFNVLVTQAGNF